MSCIDISEVVEDLGDVVEGSEVHETDTNAMKLTARARLRHARSSRRCPASPPLEPPPETSYTRPMFIDDLKKRITQAMKDRDEVAKDVLRVALGDIQTQEHRTNKTMSDEEAIAVVRKLVKSNEETMAASSGERAATLKREIELLSALLPKRMSVEEIAAALAGQREAIRAAKNDGQATGIAMKHLKASGASFDGTEVAEAVKRVRA